MASRVSAPVVVAPLLLPPPPDPPPLALVRSPDLATVVSLPDAPDPPDPPDAPDLPSPLRRVSIHVADASPPLSGSTTSGLGRWVAVSFGVNLVKHSASPSVGRNFQICSLHRLKPSLSSLFSDSSSTGMVSMTFLIDTNWSGICLRLGVCFFVLRAQSLPLPQYEAATRLFSHHLPLYEVPLPRYEVPVPLYEVVIRNLCSLSVQSVVLWVFLSDEPGVRFGKIRDGFTITIHGLVVPVLVGWQWRLLPSHSSLLRSSSRFSGSLSRCILTSIAKFRAASYALGAAAGSGNRSLCVFFDFQGFISQFSTFDLLILSCSSVLYDSIFYASGSRLAFVPAVDLAILALVFSLLNNFSMDGD